MTEINVGVVGCGKISERHLRGYQEIDGVSVTLADIVTEKAERLASEYDVSWRSDPGGLLCDSAIDAIDVCVPVTAHGDVISEALDNDKHVFCEKPLARNLKEAQDLQRRTSHAGKILMVGYLYRFHPAFQNLKQVLDDGIIGEPHYAIFRVGGRGSHRTWKHKRDRGGGVENEMLVHMLDLMVWYFGVPTDVERLHSGIVLEKREIDDRTIDATADDNIVLQSKMENGMSVLCQSDLVTPSYMNYVEVHGSNGSVMTSILDYFPTVVYCEEPRGNYEAGRNVTKFSAVDLFKRELDYFIDCVRNREAAEVNSVEDAVEVRRIIDSSLSTAEPTII